MKSALDGSDSPGWGGAGGHAFWPDPPEHTEYSVVHMYLPAHDDSLALGWAASGTAAGRVFMVRVLLSSNDVALTRTYP